MKVFIVTDLEGISGCTAGGLGQKITPETLNRQLALMMGEINAVVEGCVRAGAEEIIVGEAHPIDLAELHPRAKLARGIPWQESVRLRAFDAALFVGQHARTGLADAVRSHTGSGNSIVGFWINDRAVGELGYIGGLLGDLGVPTIFLSGDSAACREAQALIEGPVVTVAVEESHSLHGALCLPPAQVHPMLIDGVIKAFKRRREIQPIRYSLPVTFRIEYKHSQVADEHCLIPGVKREAPRIVSVTAPTYDEAYQRGIAVLASILYKYDAG